MHPIKQLRESRPVKESLLAYCMSYDNEILFYQPFCVYVESHDKLCLSRRSAVMNVGVFYAFPQYSLPSPQCVLQGAQASARNKKLES
jgi:hypothetical protein